MKFTAIIPGLRVQLDQLKQWKFKVILLLPCILCSGCEKDDRETQTILTVSELQTSTLTVPDGAIVNVTGDLRFAPGLAPALRLDGDATFKLDEQATFLWPDSVKRSSGTLYIQSKIAGNAFYRVALPQAPYLELEDIEIQDARIGLYSDGGGYLNLTRVQVQGCLQYGIYITNMDSISLDNCNMQSTGDYGLYTKFTNVRLSTSSIAGALTGVYCLDGNIEIYDCRFQENTDNGIMFNGSELTAIVEHNLFEGNGVGMYHYSNRFLRFRFNELRDQTSYSMNFPYPRTEEIQLEQNNILPGGQGNRYLLIRSGLYNPALSRHLHAVGNWWGTADSTVIRAGIQDGYHHVETDTVRIAPLLQQPVAGAGPRAQ